MNIRPSVFPFISSCRVQNNHYQINFKKPDKRSCNNMEEIWLEAQSNIEKVLTPQTFNTWIRPIKFISATNNLLELAVPNKFIQEWLVEKYLGMIQEAVSSLTDAKYQVHFKIFESA